MLTPVLSTIAETRAAVAAARKAGRRIGFVPTMGALHAGHASLIRTAKSECDCVIVSIFVNPTQFGPNEDFARYPRTLEDDRRLCTAVGTDAIFCPAPEEIYPENFRTFVEVSQLQDPLCGPSRPGHFRGVATVVLKLFNIVQPELAYFGDKDAQQWRILRRMTIDLDLPLQLRIVPTVREPDGLAMSSRNRYLDPTQRQNATVLWKALTHAKTLIRQGERSPRVIEGEMRELIRATPDAGLDYARVLDSETLQPVDTIERPALAALAVYFGTTRLIDNATLNPDAL
jgi:pantoate--beta-alanine ligase